MCASVALRIPAPRITQAKQGQDRQAVSALLQLVHALDVVVTKTWYAARGQLKGPDAGQQHEPGGLQVEIYTAVVSANWGQLSL